MEDSTYPIQLTTEEKLLVDSLFRPLCEIECFDFLRPTGSARNLVSEETATKIRDGMKAFLATRPDILVKDALQWSSRDSLGDAYGKNPGSVRTDNGSSFYLDQEWERFSYPFFVTWLESVGLNPNFDLESDATPRVLAYCSIKTLGDKRLAEIGFRNEWTLALLYEELSSNYGVETLQALASLPMADLADAIRGSQHDDQDRTYRDLCLFLDEFHLSPDVSRL